MAWPLPRGRRICPLEMIGLSYDWTLLNSKVDSMNPTGSTNQPISLVWV